MHTPRRCTLVEDMRDLGYGIHSSGWHALFGARSVELRGMLLESALLSVLQCCTHLQCALDEDAHALGHGMRLLSDSCSSVHTP